MVDDKPIADFDLFDLSLGHVPISVLNPNRGKYIFFCEKISTPAIPERSTSMNMKVYLLRSVLDLKISQQNWPANRT